MGDDATSFYSNNSEAQAEMGRFFAVHDPAVVDQWAGPPSNASLLKILHDAPRETDTESTSSGTLTPDAPGYFPPHRRPSLKERAGNFVSHLSFRTKPIASSSRIPVKNRRRTELDDTEDEYLTQMYDMRTWDMYLRITEFRKQQNFRPSPASTSMIKSVSYEPPPGDHGVVQQHHDPSDHDEMVLGDLDD